MNFLKTNKTLFHLFFIAFFCIGQVSYSENLAKHCVTSNSQNENSKVNKRQVLTSIVFFKSSQAPNCIPLEEDKVEEDDGYESSSGLNKNLVNYVYLISHNNPSTKGNRFSSKQPLYILFGSLKIPSLF